MYGVIQVYSKYSINVYYIDVGSVVDKTNFIYEYGCIGDSLQFHSCNDYGGREVNGLQSILLGYPE